MQRQERSNKSQGSILDESGEVKFLKATEYVSNIWMEVKKDNVSATVVDESSVDAPSTSE